MEEQKTNAPEARASQNAPVQAPAITVAEAGSASSRTGKKEEVIANLVTVALFGGIPYYVFIWQSLPESLAVRVGVTAAVALAMMIFFIFIRAEKVRYYRILSRGIILMLIVIGFIACSVLLTTENQKHLFKIFVIFYFSLLPPWLYLQFISTKGKTLWDEYVINLYRLHVDDYAYLPEPPQRSVFYEKWKSACEAKRQRGEAIEARAESATDKKEVPVESVYKKKFEGLFGTAPIEGTAMLAVFRGENLWPVVMATVAIAVGWVTVARPDTIFGYSIFPAGSQSSNPLNIPVDSLCFAFLGAYFYILQMLVRRYFQNDLKTDAYVSATMRIVVVILLVWMIDQLLPANWADYRLAIAFTIGVFPHIGWQALQSLIKWPMKKAVPSLEQEYRLSDLDGLNVWYESRLLEEGIEDMQNLATANLVDVMLNTRIPTERLVDWVDQSLLYLHLGKRKDDSKGKNSNVVPAREKLRRYGVRTATDLEDIFKAGKETFEYGSADKKKFIAQFERVLNDKDDEPSVVVSILATLKHEPNLYHVREWKTFAERELAKPERALPYGA